MQDRQAAHTRSVDAAFNRVLRAEAAARQALADCRVQAEQRVTTAEQQARGVTARAERRIRAAHRIADHGIERALAALTAEHDADALTTAPAPDMVEQVASALAAELTGGQP